MCSGVIKVQFVLSDVILVKYMRSNIIDLSRIPFSETEAKVGFPSACI